MFKDVDPKMYVAEGMIGQQQPIAGTYEQGLAAKIGLRAWYAAAITVGLVIRGGQDTATGLLSKVSGTEMHP